MNSRLVTRSCLLTLWLCLYGLLSMRTQAVPLVGDTWTAPVAPLTSRTLLGVTVKGTEYWACGLEGIFKSTNLTTWSKVTTSGLKDYLTDIRWTGTQFIGSGYGLWTSPDGSTWTLRFSAFPEVVTKLAFRGSIIVGVSNSGGIYRSSDSGANWTRITTPFSAEFASITANSTTFVAVGEGGAILTSPDGVEWTSRNSMTSEYLIDVAVIGTKIIAVGTNATLTKSLDNGLTWSSYAISGGQGFTLNGISGDTTNAVICGPSGTMVFTTDPANLATFNIIQTPQCQAVTNRVIKGGSGWAVVGQAGTIMTSPNGTSWTLRSPNFSYNYITSVKSSSHFLAAGFPGDKIGRSTDGAAWTFTAITQPANDVQAVTAMAWSTSPPKLVVGMSGGKIMSNTAADGSGLVARSSGINQRFYSGCHTGSQFIMVGQSGKLLTSTNGDTWVSRNSGVTGPIFGVASRGTLHIACGSVSNQASTGGFIITSSDGVGWSAPFNTPTPLFSVAWNGTLWVAAGLAGRIYTSPDGAAWTERFIDSGTDFWEGDITCMTWAGGNWLGATLTGDIVLSADGLSWKVRRVSGSGSINSIAYGAGKAVAVGESGILLNSISTAAVIPRIDVVPMAKTFDLSEISGIGTVADGTPVLSYQWRKGGVNLPGKDKAVCLFESPSALDSGSYDIVISNEAGSITSVPVNIRIRAIPQIIEGDGGNLIATVGGGATFITTAGGAGPITYQWFKSGSGALAGKTASTLMFTNLTAAAGGNYYLEATNEYGTVSTGIWSLTVAPPLATSLDLAPAINVTTAGTLNGWLGTNGFSHDGIDSGTSGTTPDGGNSWIEVTVADVSSVSFWWNVSSEANFDYLRFSVNGVPQDSISGAGTWTKRTFLLNPSSPHTLRWSYDKDSFAAVGQDRAWLDEVSFTPSPLVDLQLWAAEINLPPSRRGLRDTNGPLALENSLAYALGINPLTATPALLPALTRSNNSLLYKYTRSLRVPGITYQVQWSNTLSESSWSSVGVSDLPTFPEISEAARTATLPQLVNTPSMFARLRVSLPGP